MRKSEYMRARRDRTCYLSEVPPHWKLEAENRGDFARMFLWSNGEKGLKTLQQKSPLHHLLVIPLPPEYVIVSW